MTDLRQCLIPVLCRALVGALCITAGIASPVEAAAAANPTVITSWTIGEVPAGTPLDNLDEVVVRGKRATLAIAHLEDDFFKLYNKLNKDDRYDVNCAYVNTDPDNPGSALRSRICIPVFVADAMQHWAEGRCEIPDFISLDLNKNHVLSESEAAGNRQLLAQLYFLDTDHDRRLTYTEFLARADEVPIPCYQPPPPEQVLVAGTDKWYRQMMKVIASDPRLEQKAAYLGDLYGQLKVLQRQYSKLEDEAVLKKVSR